MVREQNRSGPFNGIGGSKYSNNRIGLQGLPRSVFLEADFV
jgi:hypothetical protein